MDPRVKCAWMASASAVVLEEEEERCAGSQDMIESKSTGLIAWSLLVMVESIDHARQQRASMVWVQEEEGHGGGDFTRGIQTLSPPTTTLDPSFP